MHHKKGIMSLNDRFMVCARASSGDDPEAASLHHAPLRSRGGWRLAPAYDLNPMPTDVKPRIHALTLDEVNDEASLDTAFSVAGAFGISRGDVTMCDHPRCAFC